MMNVRDAPATAMPFRLLRYYTVISLFSIIATSILLGSWFRSIAVDNLLFNEERNNVELARLMSSSVWPLYADFLQSASQLSVEQLRRHEMTQSLDKYLDEQFKLPGIVKIKIYDTDGYTTFSTEVSQIGSSKQNHPSFQSARQGKVVSKISFRDQFYARQELMSNLNIVSSYIPIQKSNGAPIEAVFELYKDVTPLVNEIERTQRKVIAGIILILGALFFILYFVVRRADRLIKAYNLSQQKSQEQIEHQAYHDSLTGLPNRSLLMDRLEHAIEHAKRHEHLIGVMFIDLDRFKDVNDNLGHDNGDMVIKEVATRIAGCLRPADTVARLAGDEFMVILEGVNTVDRITEIAKRIVYSMSKPIELESTSALVTCSVGISVYPFDESDTAFSLIKKADTAMYYAKDRGRNNFTYYIDDMANKGSNERFVAESDIYRGLENNEFRVYFQPKIDTGSWKMKGMEALARWEHSSEGLIMPGKFISLLEETGMISQLGETILHQSCLHSRQWQDQGLPPMSVAVNVSALQFRRHDFVESIMHILNDTGLSASYLELELTESCLIDDIEGSIDILEALSKKGVGITIDDFGTGYSSLSYLCKLPVSTLKIDKSFVSRLNNSKEHRSIITAIISFAHGLKMNIVAEGVETLEQLTYLSAMRCNTIQGFLFSQALSVEEFDKLYRSGGDFSHVLKQPTGTAS